MKRPVAKYFSISHTLLLEPHMDVVINDLCQQLENRFVDGPQGVKDCDLGEWVEYCSRSPASVLNRRTLLTRSMTGAWDLITSITFSRPYGYMEHGCDFDNSLADLDKTIE